MHVFQEHTFWASRAYVHLNKLPLQKSLTSFNARTRGTRHGSKFRLGPMSCRNARAGRRQNPMDRFDLRLAQVTADVPDERNTPWIGLTLGLHRWGRTYRAKARTLLT